MYRVATPKHRDVAGRVKQVFTAHGAVAVHAVDDADVACLHDKRTKAQLRQTRLGI